MIRNLLALFIFTSVLFAFWGQAQSPKPLWEVDLSKYGYQGRPPAGLEHVQSSASWAYQQGVAFTSPNVVVAYFVVRDIAPAIPQNRHEASISDPFRLIAVFLNTKNGELIKRMDWPLPADPSEVPPSFFFPTTNGRFLVGIGNTLSLYSPEFKLLAHMDDPSDWSPIVSPSGESLLLVTGSQVNGKWIPGYELLDTADFSILKSWNEPPSDPPYQIDAVWNDEAAWVQLEKPISGKSSLYLRTPDSAPKILLASKGELCGGTWRFVSKAELAGMVCGGGDRLLTVSTEGKICQQFDLGLEQLDGPVVASANGQRFAVSTHRWGLGRNNQPDQLAARVFDVNSATPLLKLSVEPSNRNGNDYFYGSYGDTRFGWGGLALSPGGALLALKSREKVQIYRLPDTATAIPCTDNSGQRAKANPPPQRLKSADLLKAPSPPSPQIGQILSWLPKDTESVNAAIGPLLMPKMSKDSNGTMSIEKSAHEVMDTFKQNSLSLLLPLTEDFKEEPIVASIEGSRNFRPPTGLGMMRFQGSAVAVFAGDVTARANSFWKNSAKRIVRVEQIEGCKVGVFQEKSEEDLWTTYVAFPKPNIAVVATDREYLREILARINGKHGERALPDTLPEWKHVDTHAEFWAVRHYRKGASSSDPTTQFAQIPGTEHDDGAIGVTFSFDPDRSSIATITYLSGKENSLAAIQKNMFSEQESGAREMRARYREVEPGALEGTYSLEQLESAQYFVFVVDALLGHAIYP
ncbi:MAG: hypothetical protein WBQ94_17790 [Terracidiphilus sp.]